MKKVVLRFGERFAKESVSYSFLVSLGLACFVGVLLAGGLGSMMLVTYWFVGGVDPSSVDSITNGAPEALLKIFLTGFVIVFVGSFLYSLFLHKYKKEKTATTVLVIYSLIIAVVGFWNKF